MTTRKFGRTLLVSVLALAIVLSVTGGTIAWFTDEVVSANNVIASGNLDVEMTWSKTLDGEYKDASKGAIFDYKLWEPGYTEVRYVKIKNVGTLALKYSLNVNSTPDTDNTSAYNLADVIDVYMVNPPDAEITRDMVKAATPVGTISGLMADVDGAAYGSLAAGAETTVAIALKMQESAGNEYQGLSVGDGFAVVLQATQDTVEKDSFGSDYDAGAQAVLVTSVDTAAELAEALTAGKSVRLEKDIQLTGEWAPIGDKDAGIYFTGVLDGNGHTISGLKVSNGDYVALISAAKDATIKNLTVEGEVSGDNAAGIVARVEGNTVIENCVSNVDIHANIKGGGIACNVTNAQNVIIRNCVNNGDVTGSGSAGFGGIIGYVNNDGVAHIIDCRNNGKIGAAGKYAGAAVGYAAGTSHGSIENFINTGKVEGKVIGDEHFLQAEDGTILAGYCATPANWTVDSEGFVVIPSSGNTSANNTALTDAVKALKENEEATFVMGAGTFDLPSDRNNGMPKNVEITFIGSKDTVFDLVSKHSYWDTGKLTFEGITINSNFSQPGSDYAGLYAYNTTYINCTINGPFLVGRDGAKFINCTFTNLGNDYVRTYGNDCTFENCTFNSSNGKALLIYKDGGSEVSQVTVKNCTFNASAGGKAYQISNQNCAAIEIDNSGCGVDLIISGNTINNTGDEGFSGEWRIKSYNAAKPAVSVNGTTYSTIALDGKTMTIDANKNVTVNQ